MSDEDTKSWIYSGGLPYELTEGDIVCVFSQYGEILELNLSRDRDTGKSRGFCFIKYEDHRSCELAVDNFHGASILGRKIKVSHANSVNALKSKRAANVAPRDSNEKIDNKLEKEKDFYHRREQREDSRTYPRQHQRDFNSPRHDSSRKRSRDPESPNKYRHRVTEGRDSHQSFKSSHKNFLIKRASPEHQHRSRHRSRSRESPRGGYSTEKYQRYDTKHKSSRDFVEKYRDSHRAKNDDYERRARDRSKERHYKSSNRDYGTSSDKKRETRRCSPSTKVISKSSRHEDYSRDQKHSKRRRSEDRNSHN